MSWPATRFFSGLSGPMGSLGIGIFKSSPRWFLCVASFEKHCSKASKSISPPSYPHFQNRASHILSTQIVVNSLIDWMRPVKLITVFLEILRSRCLWTSRDRGRLMSERSGAYHPCGCSQATLGAGPHCPAPCTLAWVTCMRGQRHQRAGLADTPFFYALKHCRPSHQNLSLAN